VLWGESDRVVRVDRQHAFALAGQGKHGDETWYGYQVGVPVKEGQEYTLYLPKKM